MKRLYAVFAVLALVFGYQLSAFADNCALCPSTYTCTTPPGCTIASVSGRYGCCSTQYTYPDCCQYGCYTVTYQFGAGCTTLYCITKIYEKCEIEATCINGSCQAN